MISTYIVGDAQVISLLERITPQVRSHVARTVGSLGLALQRRVQDEKLSGQALKVRTGNLRASINTEVADSGSRVAATVGTGVRYGRVHEYGFQGIVSVRAHLRHVTQVFGRPVAATQNVRAHSRQVNLPERSFLRSALREMQGTIQAALNKAVADGLQGR
ncbi:MAG TPA: phage virion morphogenesis protein [Stellaceae bacterium]|jgi:phage gpG-like protein|nr:phage virion morphogenesis protein [Stellaceae bacterium]